MAILLNLIKNPNLPNILFNGNSVATYRRRNHFVYLACLFGFERSSSCPGWLGGIVSDNPSCHGVSGKRMITFSVKNERNSGLKHIII